MKLLLSSETYSIATADITCLPDSSTAESGLAHCKDAIIIRIGNSDRGEIDELARGREAVKQATANGIEYVPVRVAFRSAIPRSLSFLSAFKQFRKKYKYHSFGIYHMRTREVRRMRIERAIRNEANAYGFRSKKWRPEESDRVPKYQRLVESIAQNGYDDNEPISIMVCRSFGVLDSLNQGHHRISAALDAGVDNIAVSFSAVSKPPPWLALLLMVPARIKRAQLHRLYREG